MAEVGRPTPPAQPPGDQPALEWQGASCGRAFQDIDLRVHPGEVVALFGKLGSGAAEVGESAFGLRPLTAGGLQVNAQLSAFRQPPAAIAAGIGFLPADRKAGGAFLVRPVAENVAVASWPNMSRLGLDLRSRRGQGVRPVARATWHPVTQ